MTLRLFGWAMRIRPLVAEEIARRQPWQLPSLVDDAADRAVLAAVVAHRVASKFGALGAALDLITFLQDAWLPWPHDLAEAAFRDRLILGGGGKDNTKQGKQPAVATQRARIIERIRYEAVVRARDRAAAALGAVQILHHFDTKFCDLVRTRAGEAWRSRIHREREFQAWLTTKGFLPAESRAVPEEPDSVFVAVTADRIYRAFKSISDYAERCVRPRSWTDAWKSRQPVWPGEYYLPSRQTLYSLGCQDLEWAYDWLGLRGDGPELPEELS